MALPGYFAAANFFGQPTATGGAGRVSGAGMAVEVEVIGLDEMITALRGISASAANLMGIAMRKEMDRIITTAKDFYVPVDTGKLRNSGKSKGPFRGTGGDVWVEGSFGSGVRNSRGQPYALIVHEIPNPPTKHPHGSWKYLQIPFTLAASSGMVDRIRNDIYALLISRPNLPASEIMSAIA